MKIDREIDFHHYTRAEMRARLEDIWARREWHGLRRVRVIHGTGAVLYKEVRKWCDEKGIPWTTEEHNPGVTILHPGRRANTAPAPPHRPLTAIRQYKEEREKAESTRQQAETENRKSSDLMAEEFARLAQEDPRTLRRRKHAQKE